MNTDLDIVRIKMAITVFNFFIISTTLQWDIQVIKKYIHPQSITENGMDFVMTAVFKLMMIKEMEDGSYYQSLRHASAYPLQKI